jgi:hypothetical protein
MWQCSNVSTSKKRLRGGRVTRSGYPLCSSNPPIRHVRYTYLRKTLPYFALRLLLFPYGFVCLHNILYCSINWTPYLYPYLTLTQSKKITARGGFGPFSSASSLLDIFRRLSKMHFSIRTSK